MSWRADSAANKTSTLCDEEKDFLKLAKKIREINKLRELSKKGEKLEGKQLEKLSSFAQSLNEAQVLSLRLPHITECLEKNADIIELFSTKAQQDLESKWHKEEARRGQRDRQQQVERHQPEFMARHDRPIVGVAVSDDGRFLFTCSKDKYVLCWSTADSLLRSIRTYAGHTGAVWSIDVSAGRLLSGGADCKILLWPADVNNSKGSAGQIVTRPDASVDHGGIVRNLRWCPFDDPAAADRRFAVSTEKLGPRPPAISVLRLSGRGFAEVLRIEALPAKTNDICWGGGAKTKLFSAHENGYIGVWLAEDPGTLLKTLKLHTASISSICLTIDGTTLLTASQDRTAAVVDISTPQMDVITTYTTDRPLNAVACSADHRAGAAGVVIVAGGRPDREVTTSRLLDDEFEAKALDAASGEVLGAGKGHFGPVHKLLSLPQLGEGGAYASISEDGCLKVHGFDGRLFHADTL